jgi:hypothetical protein
MGRVGAIAKRADPFHHSPAGVLLMAKGAGQNTSSAVMAQRAPAQVETDTPEQRLFRELDFYPTPPWAARAIAHRIKQIDTAAVSVWEPACGEGHMAEPLAEVFDVYASDIYDFGYGVRGDFFRSAGAADWVITNPPFEHAARFTETALNIAQRGAVMLCRLAFLETVGRFDLLFGDSGITWMMPFAERVPMTLGRWDPKARSATAYCAFVWFKAGLLSPQAPRPFPPGTRKQFTKPDDACSTKWRQRRCSKERTHEKASRHLQVRHRVDRRRYRSRTDQTMEGKSERSSAILEAEVLNFIQAASTSVMNARSAPLPSLSAIILRSVWWSSSSSSLIAPLRINAARSVITSRRVASAIAAVCSRFLSENSIVFPRVRLGLAIEIVHQGSRRAGCVAGSPWLFGARA